MLSTNLLVPWFAGLPLVQTSPDTYRCDHPLIVRYPQGKLGVVPPIMHPTGRVGIREVVVDRCIIAQQPASHGHLGLGVIGGDRQRITDLLLLPIERDRRQDQMQLEFRRRVGHDQGLVLLGFTAGRARAALRFRGMIGRRCKRQRG